MFRLTRNSFYKIYYLLIMALIFFMPINMTVCSYIIALLAIIWVAEVQFKEKFKNIFSSGFTLLFISYFLIYLIGLTYSRNLSFGFFDLGIKISILIFPILLSSFDKEFYQKLDIKVFLRTFILGCFLASAICLSYAIFQYSQLHTFEVFYYKSLSIFYHPSYFSMFLNFAIAILIYYLIEEKSIKLTFSKLESLTLLLLFSVMVILLSSKAGMISLGAILIISLFNLFVLKKKYILAIISILIIIPLFIGLLKIFPYSIARVEYAKKTIMNKDYDNNKSEDAASNRIQIWKACVSLIKENLIFGVGTGDVKDKLLEKYKQNHLFSAYEKKLNAHNQFLQTFVATGIIGFLIIIMIFLLPLIMSIKERQMLYFTFIVLIIINVTVESMFERQAGVIFYAFFNSLLFFSYNKSKALDINK